jgi:hypothetical protein
MTYTAKAAVGSEIRKKHSTQSEHHVEFFNVRPDVTQIKSWALIIKLRFKHMIL